MRLVYSAYDRSGRQVSDTVEAAGVAQASEDLRRRGLFVATIAPASITRSVPAPHHTGAIKAGGAGRRLKNLAQFTRQLYVLMASGTPLVESLGALGRQTRDRNWQQIIAAIRRSVEEGQTLAGAMEAYPHAFDAVFRSLVAAGESSGRLPAMLQRLGQLVQRRLHVRNAVVGAMVYPCLLLMIAMNVMGVLITFVIPRFGELFKTLDVPLPASTRMLLDLSAFIRGNWWIILLGVGAGVGGLYAWLVSAGGRRAVDSLVLRLPQFGRIVRSFVTARVTRLLGVLLEAKVPVLEALTLARDAARNARYVELLRDAETAVTRGQGIASAFMDSDLVSPSVAQAMRNGEQSGQLGPLLLEISDFLDEDNEIVLRSLTSILEPIILILLGVLVGGMAISLFTPLFDVASIMQGGGG